MGEMKITCINCPVGCEMDVASDERGIKITGHGCKIGLSYAKDEIDDPKRVITTIIYTGKIPLSVKSDRGIGKNLIFPCLEEIYRVKLCKNVRAGDVIIENILGSGANIVATKDYSI